MTAVSVHVVRIIRRANATGNRYVEECSQPYARGRIRLTDSWPTLGSARSACRTDFRRDLTMTTREAYETSSGGLSAPAPRGWPLIASAVGFVLLYLGTDFVIPTLASSALPLPNAPLPQVRGWFADNQLAAVMIGACQALSVACLAVFVSLFGRAAVTARQATAAGRARPWGLAAVALMVLSSVLGWVLAVLAPSASLDAVFVLRTANFIAGGTAHVVALGVFVVLASRMPGFGRPVRVWGYVAAVPAIVSVVSLVWFQGAAFILLGRLLCMVWTISAAVSITRRRKEIEA